MHHYTGDEGWYTHLILFTTCCHRWSKIPRKWWDCLVLDKRSNGIPLYTNAQGWCLGPKGTVVATDNSFIKNSVFVPQEKTFIHKSNTKMSKNATNVLNISI